ncbi:histidine phosphatase family protein [Aliterella atlantica]|uniref:histidine phosphatase family protein n=1 Tax=Aliterella atlantica TaxID=1827278 RepID=UPI0005D30715|nr:histidine phosphatase family protein [Aliterella atlantica]
MRSKHKDCQATRVILVRHGQSTYNALGLYQGSSDESVLTQLGRSDAQKTGEFLKGITFDAIYSSSLKRAQETAQEILKVISCHTKLRVTDKLRETDLPVWQGLAFAYVRETFPAEYRLWKQRPHEFWMEYAGSLERQGRLQKFFPALDLYQRVREFWQEVLPRHQGQTLLLVTHGGTNRALISTALGITPDRYHCIQQSNCGISILNFPDGSLASGQLEVMNCNAHVGEHLPKPQEGGKGLRLLLVPSGTNAAQTQNIANFLQQVRIEFSLSSAIDSAQTAVQQILQHHRETVQLEVLRADISEWQTATTTRSTANSEQLITGLMVASEATIARLICHAIGKNLDQSEQLLLKTGSISCLQYLGDRHPPILQAMNLTTAQSDSILMSDLSTNTVLN